jgi:hypothetical protein
LTLAYEGVSGTQTFSLPKDYLKGVLPKANGYVTFFPTDITQNTDAGKFAKDFEKFRFDSAQGVFPQGSQGVVGYVMK